ncbi:hypothetical protein E2C01_032597 [Portunus trituberculatus]|uniref:Uncharacterized protein n=1 Tax=Portunus trituberculatus TaxID=210409 RepID=A0A5B7F148_PORTR|nr:hypothetical protein [Portunus trituberculatus]
MSEYGLRPTGDIEETWVYVVKSTWLRRWEEEGEDLEDKRKGGNHPRGTTENEDQSIVQTCETNPHLNAQQIEERLNIQASMDTVRRLHQAGLHHHTPAMTDHLTQHNDTRIFVFNLLKITKRKNWISGEVIFFRRDLFLSSTWQTALLKEWNKWAGFVLRDEVRSDSELQGWMDK